MTQRADDVPEPLNEAFFSKQVTNMLLGAVICQRVQGDARSAEAQKKALTNRYSLLDKPTVRSINRHVRSQPQSIFTPRVSSLESQRV